jgi:hypothetical protein
MLYKVEILPMVGVCHQPSVLPPNLPRLTTDFRCYIMWKLSGWLVCKDQAKGKKLVRDFLIEIVKLPFPQRRKISLANGFISWFAI